MLRIENDEYAEHDRALQMRLAEAEQRIAELTAQTESDAEHIATLDEQLANMASMRDQWRDAARISGARLATALGKLEEIRTVIA